MTTIWVLLFGMVIGVGFTTLWCFCALAGVSASPRRKWRGTRMPTDGEIDREACGAYERMDRRFRVWAAANKFKR